MQRESTTTYYIKTAPADAVAAMGTLEFAVPELGDNWATNVGLQAIELR